ncbi:Hemolymph lipopolysaccharide-binding protein, partial [Gryllus bimaculatus]
LRLHCVWQARARGSGGGGGGECIGGGVQLHVVAATQRNASGAWSVATSASSDVAARVRPRLHLEATLGVGVCPRGLVTLSAHAAVAAAAPAGYERLRIPGVDSLYRLQAKALPWPQARAACEAEGAHLIVVNSEAEAQVVRELFGRASQFEGAINSYWLAVGLRRSGERNETVLGAALEASGYARWAPLDGQWAPGPGKDCGIMDRRMLFAYELCTHKRAFICEFEADKALY